MNPLFEARDLGYSYGTVSALRRVSLTVRRGDRIALLGSNGSGKSTLLRILDGLVTPSEGQFLFDGVPVTEDRLADEQFVIPFRRRVALLFQDPDVQLFNSTVFDEVAFGPLHLRWPRERIAEAVESTLHRLEIGHLRDRAPYRLSGGEKKRTALASILVLDPEVLLLDEPAAALDPRSQSQFLEFIAGLGSERTVITATHDLETVQHISTYCFVLFRGEIVAEGKPADVLSDLKLLESVNLIYAHRHGESKPHFHPQLPHHHS